MREKQRRILLRLRAAVEVPVQQRKDPPRRLEQLIAVSAAAFPAGHQTSHGGLAVDQLLAGKR